MQLNISRVNPHKLIKSSSFDVNEAKSRRKDLGIPSFDAVNCLHKDPPGYPQPEPYAHKPLNRYQKAMRALVSDGRVKYQYTRCLASDVVERTVTIPLEANAYHDGKRNIVFNLLYIVDIYLLKIYPNYCSWTLHRKRDTLGTSKVATRVFWFF